jgi:hypothetical protein
MFHPIENRYKCHAIIEVSEQQGIVRAHQTIEASFFS